MKNVLLVMFLIPFCGFSQSRLDSVYANHEKGDGKRLDTMYYDIGKYYSLIKQFDISKSFFDSALIFSQSYENNLLTQKIYYAIGFNYQELGNFKDSEYYLNESLKYALDLNLDQRLIYSYFQLGDLYAKNIQYDRAIENYLNCLKIAQKNKDIPFITSSYNNIGHIYLNQYQYRSALENFTKALEIKTANEYYEGICINKLNIAICYKQIHNYSKSYEYCKDLLLNWDKCYSENIRKNELYNILTGIHLYNKNLDSATYYNNRVISMANVVDDTDLATAYCYRAELFLSEELYDSAITNIFKSINHAKEVNHVKLIVYDYELLHNTFYRLGKYIDAYKFSVRLTQFKDSVFPNYVNENIRRSYIDYERYQSQQIIKAKETIIQQNSQLTILLGIVSLLSIITVILAKKNASTRKKLNEKLSDEVEERTQELNTFLYRTSHDLAGPLARMKGLLKLIDSPMTEMETRQFLDRLNLTTEKMGEVIKRLELISKINVSPLMIEKINLEIFLDEIIRQMQIGHEIIPTLEVAGDKYFMADKKLLGHIIQNILQNSFTHIDRREPDKRIFIRASNLKRLDILIGDTGTGIIDGHEKRIFELFFSGIDKNNRAGIGLYFANIAAKRLGGRIILKQKRKPTLFEVQIPKIMHRKL